MDLQCVTFCIRLSFAVEGRKANTEICQHASNYSNVQMRPDYKDLFYDKVVQKGAKGSVFCLISCCVVLFSDFVLFLCVRFAFC